MKMSVACLLTVVFKLVISFKFHWHTPHILTDFLPGIVRTTIVSTSLDNLSTDSQADECMEEVASDADAVICCPRCRYSYSLISFTGS